MQARRPWCRRDASLATVTGMSTAGADTNPISPGDAAGLWMLLAGREPATTRDRLLVGMAAAIVERGLTATTVADVVRQARASRRTFYEHFSDRDDCYLALYEVMIDRLVWLFEQSVVERDDWREEMLEASRVYLNGLVAVPALARAAIAEMTGLGIRGLRARMVGLQLLAGVLVTIHDESRARHAEVPSRPISREQALVLIGGQHELVLEYVLEDRIAEVPDRLAPVFAHMLALVGVQAPD